jgi:hypothetical protein
MSLRRKGSNASFDRTEDPSSTDDEMETPERMLEAYEERVRRSPERMLKAQEEFAEFARRRRFGEMDTPDRALEAHEEMIRRSHDPNAAPDETEVVYRWERGLESPAGYDDEDDNDDDDGS